MAPPPRPPPWPSSSVARWLTAAVFVASSASFSDCLLNDDGDSTSPSSPPTIYKMSSLAWNDVVIPCGSNVNRSDSGNENESTLTPIAISKSISTG